MVKTYEQFEVTLASRKTPWELGLTWSEGQKPGDYTVLATAQEMLEAAGMAGWNVAKEPAYRANGEQIPGAFANYTEDGRFLGNVGRTYNVFQNEEIFAFGDNIVDSGQAKWERAGGYKGGAIVFGCMELTHLGIRVPGDDSDLKPYLLLVNTFDGSYPAQGILALTRPVCINTFQMAVGTATPHRFAIKHVGSLDGKLVMAREAIGIAFQHVKEAAPIIQKLAKTKVVDEQVRRILETAVWPIADDASDEVREASVASKAFEVYQTSDTIESIRGTAWGAFNAVTETVDHLVKYAGRGISTGADVKGTSLLWGAGEQRKEAALKALVKLAK